MHILKEEFLARRKWRWWARSIDPIEGLV